MICVTRSALTPRTKIVNLLLEIGQTNQLCTLSQPLDNLPLIVAGFLGFVNNDKRA